MKRLTLILLIVVVLAGLAASLWGNRLVATTLDARLAPLLTKQLGLPVTLSPMEAHLLSLTATSAKLVMGEPSDPAVVATDVAVRLSLPDLLTGNVRLILASADDLMVKPSRWPSSDSPAPDNYRFLDPWLPRNLQFNTGRFVLEDGSTYPVQTAAWRRRLAGGMQVTWSEQRRGGPVNIEAELGSLEDLLDLADLELTIAGEIDDVESSAFTWSLQIQPGAKDPYFLNSTLEAIGTRLTTEASGSERWHWPDSSSNHYDHLDLGQLGDFMGLYASPGETNTAESFLATPLPALNLVAHKGQLTIDTITLAGESYRNTTLSFAADRHGVRINPLQMDGPRARLNGAIIIDSTENGWDFSLDAELQAHKGASIGQNFVDTEWRWEGGNARLRGQGNTWGDLLYALQGHITTTGHHVGEVDTPVGIDAVLDSHSGEFALDQLEVRLGEGRFHGGAKLSGTDQRKLTLELTGEKLDLEFLFNTSEDNGRAGVPVPKYLNVMPSLDLDLSLKVSELDAPGLRLASASAQLERGEGAGALVAQVVGITGGTLDINLDANYPKGTAGRYALNTRFNRLDLPRMFEQPNLLHSRSSGTLNFEGNGTSMLDIFQTMRGNASLEVEVRPDNNWKRTSNLNETLKLSGDGSFVLEATEVVGISIENLDIDSSEQDLSGSLSMVATRTPWLIAELQSEQLDINGLKGLLPETPEEADSADFLDSVRRMGAARLSVKVDALTVGDAPISRLELKMESDENLLRFEEMAFFAHGSKLEGNGEITWQGPLARIEASTRLTDVDLDQFLILDPTMEHVPVNGTAQLSSEGKTVGELIGNLTGHIDLASKELQPGTGDPSRYLLMTARRVTNGVEAEIQQLRLGENYLTGSLRYLRESPPQVDVTIHGGTFSLRPWETGHVEPDAQGEKTPTGSELESGIRQVASASAGAVGRVLRAPLRLFQASEDRSKERLFSDTPLPLDTLNQANVNFKGQLDSLESSVVTLRQLSFDGTVQDGTLTLKARAGELNEGQAEVELTLDANAQPPRVALKSDFNDVRGLTSDNTYTRSGFASLEARGESTAALAASLNGLIYLDLGPGPFDYRNATLISSGIASQVINTLIPGSTKKTPQLECGITVAEFTEGKGVTPYGYAIRTNQANLLGYFKLDLAKERMELNFEARSREGMGISVGNVISNSVQVRGSLTNPGIVPRATSLAWRGWAAFMTAGLSVVAESVLKRAMASGNPCPPIKKLISTELCAKSEIAAASPRVCPQGATAATQ